MKLAKCIRKFFRYEWSYYKDHRETPQYRARLSVVKTWWIWYGVLALVLLQFPFGPGMIAAGTLAMTFLSLGFLDEWRHFRGECEDDDE